MKKILMLGNHEIVIYNFRKELVSRLLSEGYEVTVVCPYGKKIEYLKEMGCRFIDIQINRRNTNPLEDLSLLMEYIKILKKVKPDIVLTYTIKPNVYGGIACRLRKVPYIANITGLGSGFINGGVLYKIVSRLYKTALKKADMVFFQNEADRDLLTSKKIVRDNYDLLPGSGVNLSVYQMMPYPEADQPVQFNFIARIMKDKGIDEYLEAAEYIKKEHPEVIFNVIGMIDQPQYEEILRRNQEAGIICYHGFQSNIKPFIEKCSCTINPSHTEGMSNVLLESAACGRPIIASDIPGCREIVTEDINGWTFEVKNTKSLIEKIEKFLSLSYEDKKQMGHAGRKIVESRFDRNIVVNKYLQIIKKIVRG